MRVLNPPPPTEATHRALDLRALLQMVGVVLTLVVSVAGSQVPRWFFFVPVGYFFLLIAVYICPYAWKRAMERRRLRLRYKRLADRWGNFRDQIESLRGFFDPQRPDSLPSLMLGLAVRLSENKVTGITQQELDLINGYLAFLNDQLTTLAFRVREEPTDMAKAHDLIRDFEILAESPARLGIFVTLLRIRGDALWDKGHHEILEGFKQRLRNYELFARQTNRETGEGFFLEHLRTL